MSAAIDILVIGDKDKVSLAIHHLAQVSFKNPTQWHYSSLGGLGKINPDSYDFFVVLINMNQQIPVASLENISSKKVCVLIEVANPSQLLVLSQKFRWFTESWSGKNYQELISAIALFFNEEEHGNEKNQSYNLNKVSQISDFVTQRLNNFQVNFLEFFLVDGSIGSLVCIGGNIVDCCYLKSRGLKALSSILTNKVKTIKTLADYNWDKKTTIEDLNVNNFPSFCNKTISRHESVKALKPPENIFMKINSNKLRDVDVLSPAEFKVLIEMDGSTLASDVYNNCTMLNYIITEKLISLRKQSILTVI